MSDIEWTSETPPVNRIDCRIHITADDLDELQRALLSIVFDNLEWQERGAETIDTQSGGYGSGWDLKVTVPDPEQTGERYRDQLRAWGAMRRRNRAARARELDA